MSGCVRLLRFTHPCNESKSRLAKTLCDHILKISKIWPTQRGWHSPFKAKDQSTRRPKHSPRLG